MKTVPSAAVASNALFIEAPRLTPKNDSTPPFATVCCFRNNKVEINPQPRGVNLKSGRVVSRPTPSQSCPAQCPARAGCRT